MWLGIVISAIALWLAFRQVSWNELATAVLSVDWSLLGLAAVIAMFDQFLRGLRWRQLLVPVGQVPTVDSFSYLSIGALANSVLPLRAGEVIRAALLGKKLNLSKSAVFATVVVERIFDVLMLVAIALALFAAMPILPEVKRTILLFGAVGLGLFVMMWWIAGHLAWVQSSRLGVWAQRIGPTINGLPERPRRVAGIEMSILTRKLWHMVESFVGGMGAIRSPRLAVSVGVYTMLAWGASIAYVWLVLRACQLDLPWTASLMVLVVVNFGAAIPSSPGALGVAHFLAVLALSPWDVPPGQALTFAIMVHAVVFSVMVGVGLACLWREGIGFRQLAKTDDQPESPTIVDPELTL